VPSDGRTESLYQEAKGELHTSACSPVTSEIIGFSTYLNLFFLREPDDQTRKSETFRLLMCMSCMKVVQQS